MSAQHIHERVSTHWLLHNTENTKFVCVFFSTRSTIRDEVKRRNTQKMGESHAHEHAHKLVSFFFLDVDINTHEKGEEEEGMKNKGERRRQI